MTQSNGTTATPGKRIRLEVTTVTPGKQIQLEITPRVGLDEPTTRTYDWRDIADDAEMKEMAEARSRGGHPPEEILPTEEIVPPLSEAEELAAIADPFERQRAEASWYPGSEDDYEMVPWRNTFVPLHIKEDLAKVHVAWQKTVEAIVATGTILIAMQDRVDHGEWLNLFKRGLMPFGKRTAQKLTRIARNPAIAQNSAHFPSSVDALDLLAPAPRDVLMELVKSGAIKPDLTIEQTRDLVALKLPKLVGELTDIVTKYEAEEAARHAAYLLWKQDKAHTRAGLAWLAEWMADLTAAYKKLEDEHREEWLAEADNAYYQAQVDKEVKRKRRSKRGYFGSPRKTQPWRWAGKLKNTEHLKD